MQPSPHEYLRHILDEIEYLLSKRKDMINKRGTVFPKQLRYTFQLGGTEFVNWIKHNFLSEDHDIKEKPSLARRYICATEFAAHRFLFFTRRDNLIPFTPRTCSL
jgi:hypothetical protein